MAVSKKIPTKGSTTKHQVPAKKKRPSDLVTQQYSLQVPIISGKAKATVQVLVDIEHRPQTKDETVCNSQLSQSIQRTIENHLRQRDGLQVINDPSHSCFVLNTLLPISFQENVGKHTTIISRIKVTIPYSSSSTKIKELDYEADITVYYQQKTDSESVNTADVLTLVGAGETVSGLDCYVKTVAAKLEASGDMDGWSFFFWDFDQRPQHIEDIFSPKPMTEPLSLDLEICKSFVVLKTMPQADKKTVDRLTSVYMQKQLLNETDDVTKTFLGLGAIGGLMHVGDLRFHRSHTADKKNHCTLGAPFPSLSIQDCRDYVRVKRTLTSRARRNGLIAWVIALGISWLFWTLISNGPTSRTMVTAIVVFLTGPLGIIAGLL